MEAASVGYMLNFLYVIRNFVAQVEVIKVLLLTE
jgi:hypothetical protein